MLKLNILLVDDLQSFADTTVMMLEALGHTVEHVKSGGLAISKPKEDVAKLDLIITDILMPDGDGIELMNHLSTKQNEGWTVPPVIASSGGGSQVDKALITSICEKYANCFLPKPFTSEELKKAIGIAIGEH